MMNGVPLIYCILSTSTTSQHAINIWPFNKIQRRGSNEDVYAKLLGVCLV